MSNTSTYLQTARLNQTLRGMVYVPPTNLYVALFTADPTDGDASANEVAAPWYARVATGTATGWGAPVTVDSTGEDGMQSSNLGQLTFGAVTGAQVTITHVGVMDAANGGDLLYHVPLAAPKILQVGDVLQFAPGDLTVIEA